MNDLSFDALARHAAGRISRRTSLGTLGATGLAALGALSGAFSATARKKGKKKRGGANVAKKADQKCEQQEVQCLDFFKATCAADQECAIDAILCCRVIGECDVIGFLLCIDE